VDLESDYPYWRIASGLIRTYAPLEADADCDVVVVGGGLTGALIAFHLVEAGLSTIILDRRDFAWGSTSASTALVLAELDTPYHQLADRMGEAAARRIAALCRDAVADLGRLVERLGIRCGHESRPSLYLASRRKDIATLEREHRWRAVAGLEGELWDRRELARRAPFERPAALYFRDAAQLDPYRLAHGLLHGASGAGLRAYDRTMVTGWNLDPSDHGRFPVRLQTDRRASVRARRVIFASGYEAQQLLRHPEVALTSTYALVSEPLRHFSGWPERCLIWETARPYLYVRSTEDGRAMVGGEDDAHVDPKRRDSRIRRKCARLSRQFHALFPEIELEPAYAWAGTFAETADGLPFIGEHPDYPHAYFALCYGGNGTIFGLIAAELARAACLGLAHEDDRLFGFGRNGRPP
jgi:glycine/D-amino acid oxidase-like deaminating enzyme